MGRTSRAASAATAPLLDRERETQALRDALDRAANGYGSLVMVEGPAGIGKTRLLSAAADIAGEAGLLVRSARGGEMEQDLPFGVARQLFEGLLERTSDEEKQRLLAGSAQHALSALGRLEQESRVDLFAPINGLYWLVANIAERQPVLLVIDDAHWADAASLRFLTFLARRLADMTVLVILGIRIGEPNEPKELTPLRLEAERLQPQPLGPRSVHELIAATAGHEPTARFSTACTSATAGNPFFVAEVVRELRSEGLGFDDETAVSISKLVPENVATSVLLRLGRFGNEAIAIARAIALLGRASQIRHVAELAHVDEPVTRKLCDDLRGAEILAAGVPLDFVHPLVRQAVYKELPEGERAALHRRAADVLAQSAVSARDIVSHLLATPPNGDEWVAARLREAADAAMDDGAYESAVTYLERALEEPPKDRMPFLFALGVALFQTDTFRAPGVLSQVADQTLDQDLRVAALKQLVLAYQTAGNLPEIVRTCEVILDVLGDDRRDLALAVEAHRFSYRRWSGRDDLDLLAPLDDELLTREGDTPGELVMRQALAFELFLRAAPAAQVIELALRFPPSPWRIEDFQAVVPLGAAKALAWSGRWKEGAHALRRWMAHPDIRGSLAAACVGNGFVSEISRVGGDLFAAEAEGRTAWEIARSIGPMSALGWTALTNLAATLFARGSLDEARSLTDNLNLEIDATLSPVTPVPLELRGYLRIGAGDLEGGVEDLLAAGESLERVVWLNPSYPPWRQEAAEVLARLGRTAEATELVRVAEDRARGFGAGHALASVLRARSFVEPRKRSIDTLGESVVLFETHGPVHELARSLMELGAALHRDGRRSEARDPLRRALELGARCGAGSIEERAREELAAVGERPRRYATSGVAALTAMERHTAELATSGMTNKEIAERLFVTLRTVETHLTHVYQKLSISGRRELGRAMRDYLALTE